VWGRRTSRGREMSIDVETAVAGEADECDSSFVGNGDGE